MKPPAFQFYARDWLSSTLGMPWDVAGVYIHLLAWSWDNGPLPDDAKWRARVLGSSTPQAHARLWKAVCSRWVKTPAGGSIHASSSSAAAGQFPKRAEKGKTPVGKHRPSICKSDGLHSLHLLLQKI